MFWWKPISPTFSYFPASALHAPRESCQPCKTTVQMKVTPSPNLGLLQGTDCCGPGVQLAGCCSWRNPLGFQFCADPCKCASAGKKSQTYSYSCRSPQGRLWQMSPKCLIFPDPKDIGGSLKGSRMISARLPGNDCLPIRNRA